MEKDRPDRQGQCQRLTALPNNRLSRSTEAWIEAAIAAGNRADRDPEYAAKIGKSLY
ncbi:hypothetical protein [Sphingomonas sp. TREG-RG-20F-R18-01]|uniref:hypothetical protein n=1 Tax=Sphingomonas sp. TREG-RG-20F-R18-01 TaxID=2914982 RepID=UPI001F57EDAE|nr:hypothetical protein [Sphingomonas sp. TREG-RG-20F-R18-01]